MHWAWWIVIGSTFSFKLYRNESVVQKRRFQRNPLRRVVGGIEVPIELHPYVAQVTMFEYKWKACEGTILTNRIILTAAHCLTMSDRKTTYPAKSLEVSLGSAKLKKGGKVYKVCTATRHEKFDLLRRPGFYFYDIGLILLRRTIKFGATIQKIQIASHLRWRNNKSWFTSAGFGKRKQIGEKTKKKLKKVLTAVRLQYVPVEVCRESPTDTKYKKFLEMPVPDHMFCLRSERWAGDCFGDSGSGVTWKGFLVGVVSVGRSPYCGSTLTPAMYVDAVYFQDWITENIAKLENLPKSQCH